MTLGNREDLAGGDASFLKGDEAPAERAATAANGRAGPCDAQSRSEELRVPAELRGAQRSPAACCTAAGEKGGDARPVSRARPFSAARRAAPPLVRHMYIHNVTIYVMYIYIDICMTLYIYIYTYIYIKITYMRPRWCAPERVLC